MADCIPNIIQNGVAVQQTGPRTVIIPADPLIWSASTNYEYLTLVASENFANGYVSKKDVPAGTPLTNTEYWIPVANFNAQLANLTQQLADEVERATAADEANAKAIEDNAKAIEEVATVGTAIKESIDAEIIRAKNAETNIIEAVNASPFYLLCTPTSNTNLLNFFFTDNFESIYPIKTVAIPGGQFDFSYMKKYHDWYYIFSNNSYVTTKDFINFNLFNPKPGEYIAGWGFTIDEHSDTVIYSNGVGSPITVTNYMAHISNQDDETGELTIGNGIELSFPKTGSDNYIDIDVLYKNSTYYFAVKSETEKKAKLFTAQNIAGPYSEVTFNDVYGGYEAPKLIDSGDSIDMLVSVYSIEEYLKQFITGDYNFGNYNTDYSINKPVVLHDVFNTAIQPRNRNMTFSRMDALNRHLSYIAFDDNILRAFSGELKRTQQFEHEHTLVMINGDVTYNGPIIPNLFFYIGGSGTVVFNFNNIEGSAFTYEKELQLGMQITSGATALSVKIHALPTFISIPEIIDKELNANNSSADPNYKIATGKIFRLVTQHNNIGVEI